MTMPCSITDLVMPSNDYQSNDESNYVFIGDLNMHDIMGEDFYCSIHKIGPDNIKLEIENADGTIYTQDSNVHPYALESMAHFCRSFLKAYEKNEA